MANHRVTLLKIMVIAVLCSTYHQSETDQAAQSR